MSLSLYKILILISIFFSFYQLGKSQDDEDLFIKLSPEIRTAHFNNKLDIRIRPVDYTYPFKSARFDLMLGVPLMNGLFKVFSYTKFDTKDRFWSGIRLENNYHLADKRLQLHFQFRFFWGLNDSSADHYYFINAFQYKSTKHFNPGLLGFGRKMINIGDKAFWFLGPMNTVNITKNLRLISAICYDVLKKHKYFLFVRLGLRFPVETSLI